MTTAADVAVHMKMAAKDSMKANEKEIRNLRGVYTAYMKHSLLRPILESELGPHFFKRIPSSKEELNFKLDEIRSVFNRAGIHDNIIGIILMVGNVVEHLPPQFTGGYNFSGLTPTLAAELMDMEQLIAEVECEYGGWLEASLAKRLLMKLVRVAKSVADANAGLLNQSLSSTSYPDGATSSFSTNMPPAHKKSRKTKNKDNQKSVTFDE